MKIRSAILFAGALSATTWMASGAIAADLTDVGYVDQADVANLPVFVNANRQLASYKSQLDGQFNAQVKHVKTDAERQQLALQFQQQLQDKQREIVGPLLQRAQLAIAAVSSTRNLSVVVDKRIVIYGGQDITRDVEAVFTSPQAITPPVATPPPSEIGFVDQTVLDGVPKVQTANSAMNQFETTQRQVYAARMAQARSSSEKQQILQQFNKTVADKQDQLLKPLVDQTRSATSAVARKKNLVLVVDKADVISGGTDITADVQNELAK
ncbi:MAG TPA: OmpH family outer membrane protein [Candidatus Acidoferrales bacterium]|nr:OmpH family outer membrane protein [Candidatus Acidoferrales bacterium]